MAVAESGLALLNIFNSLTGVLITILKIPKNLIINLVGQTGALIVFLVIAIFLGIKYPRSNFILTTMGCIVMIILLYLLLVLL